MFPVGLDRVVDILEHLQSPAIRVNGRQCTRVRHRRSTCTRCAEACPTHAITWQDTLQVESSQCVDCGICATVCPSGALEAQAPTNAELLEQIKTRVAAKRPILFACPRYLETTHAAAGQVVQVKCLGRLDESVLMGAVAEGASSVALLDSACADCPQAIGRNIAEQVVQRTNALLAAFGVASRVAFDAQRLSAETKPGSTSTADGLSRRAFFDYLRRETVKVTATTVTSMLAEQAKPAEAVPVLPRGELPTRVPSKHELLLTVLRKIGKPVTAEWNGGIWAQFGFTEKCNGCQMCAFFCPTGALTKMERECKLGVAFQLALCTDCRLCQEMCYLDAVTLAPTVDLNKVAAGTVDSFLMVDAESALWKLPPDERLKRTIFPAIGKLD